MLNNTVLVGRLVNDPELYETETGKKLTRITLAVPRSYKNINGEYDTDYIGCKMWQAVAQNATDYCKKGDLLGVKGRLQTSSYETEDGIKYITEVVAEKITFLSSKQGLIIILVFKIFIKNFIRGSFKNIRNFNCHVVI